MIVLSAKILVLLLILGGMAYCGRRSFCRDLNEAPVKRKQRLWFKIFVKNLSC